MRQFLLGGNVAYPAAAADLSALAAGAIGIFHDVNGVLTLTADGANVKNKAFIALGRSAANGGPVTLPLFKNNFTFVKGVYQAATTFVATVVIPAPTVVGEYTILVAKKGVAPNEKYLHTASVYVDNASMTAAQLAQKLVTQINNDTTSSGVKATLAAATITITAETAGVDYTILTTDKLSGVVPTITTAGVPAYGNAAYVMDLANKAAADAGFEYTYDNDVRYLYPNYPINPLAAADSADVGFTIFTLRFAEPREMKTRDEVVHQIVQIAYPTGAAAIATMETILETLSGIPLPVVP